MSTIDPLEHILFTTQQRYSLPAGTRQIILVRHGSAGGDYSRPLRIGTLLSANPPLTPDGHSQAQAVARRLVQENVRYIFVTPLTRTLQTAAPLASLTGIAPIEITELHEVHMGEWEHEFHERMARRDPLLGRMVMEESYEIIPGAERMANVAARVRTGIDKIIGHMEQGTSAVAVVHGGIIGDICRQAAQSRPFAFFGPENASITRLIISSDQRWSLRGFNDVAHLSVGI